MVRAMVFCALFAFCTVFGLAAEADTVKIGAIFAVTGPNANLGTPEARTLQMLVEEANKAGGIAGKSVELFIKDSQGNAEKAISFAKQLIEEEEVLAIIGPSTSGESMKLKGLCNDAEMILLSCAAAETIVNPVAKWVFKVAPMDGFAAQMIFTTMKKMGITRIGALSSNSGFGQGGKAQLEKLAPATASRSHLRGLRQGFHGPHAACWRRSRRRTSRRWSTGPPSPRSPSCRRT